ncbi:uncharacterized protein LOC132918330 [Rhopalosiphum padi]|uniref:uncharacterized protein LOC132918330 n=1 Tax=Rhopalosiphum padi TaxID=40932 RepID=UPI00298DB545|nr:uncharacterized protein LOC132918330 [Rhopalosiphum padi]
MLTLSYLAWPYLMAVKNKLFSDCKMKEPERKDNEKISANNSNIVEKRSTATTPLQQAAELLERSQQLLKAAYAEAAVHATTETAAHATSEAATQSTTEAAAQSTSEAATQSTTEAAAQSTSEAAAHATTEARVRRMSMQELLRDPALWVAYTRGWDDCAGKATNVNPKPAVTDRSQSPRRPVQPAGTSRPPPIPQSARLPRPPPQPLMAVLVPRPKFFKPPTPPATRKVNQKSAQRPPTTAPSQNSWQRRNQSRITEYPGQKKAGKPTTSQQYRLEKPAPSTTQPAPGPKSLVATTTPVPEAKTPEVAMPTGQTEASAISIPVDTKVSPVEKKELLCDMMDVGPPDDVDTVFQITSPDSTTPPRHGYTMHTWYTCL